MTLPKYSEVDLALLLELVRIGRTVRPHEVYERVERHFPLLTDDDKTELRQDGRTRVWTNMIHWARDHLRVQGALADTNPGDWAVNESAPQLLEDWLRKRGGVEVSAFVSSDQTLPALLGSDWARELRQRRVVTKRPDSSPRPANYPQPSPSAMSPPSKDDLSALLKTESSSINAELLGRLRAMDEYDFENFVGRVLDALGFRDTVVVGRPGDGGVDVRCTLRNDVVSATVAVQVKRQQSNVGPKDISYLRDRWGRKVDKLLFVTTSDYTAGAREVAEEDGLKLVSLVNGSQFAELMVQHKIGITARPVERLLIDEEFFIS